MRFLKRLELIKKGDIIRFIKIYGNEKLNEKLQSRFCETTGHPSIQTKTKKRFTVLIIGIISVSILVITKYWNMESKVVSEYINYKKN